jgi:hypothetical protein
MAVRLDALYSTLENAQLSKIATSASTDVEQTVPSETGPIAEAKHLSPKWPDFFIVGAQNSATTSLYAYLQRHPQIFMPAMKEPHYFSQLSPIGEMRYPSTHVSNARSYLKLFAKAPNDRLSGEASSSYLWDPETPARIHTANPDAKILIILRDPIGRAYSQYLKDFREGWQDLPFHETIRRDFALQPKGYGLTRLYVELGLYHQQVRRYLEVFGPEQVKIILFKRLTSGSGLNAAVLKDVAEFLQIDPARLPSTANAQIENGFAVPRWKWARRAAGSRVVRCLGRVLMPPRFGSTYTIKRLIYEPLLTRHAAPPPIDAEAKEWLKSLYDPDLTALEGLLHQRLPELRASW